MYRVPHANGQVRLSSMLLSYLGAGLGGGLIAGWAMVGAPLEQDPEQMMIFALWFGLSAWIIKRLLVRGLRHLMPLRPWMLHAIGLGCIFLFLAGAITVGVWTSFIGLMVNGLIAGIFVTASRNQQAQAAARGMFVFGAIMTSVFMALAQNTNAPMTMPKMIIAAMFSGAIWGYAAMVAYTVGD